MKPDLPEQKYWKYTDEKYDGLCTWKFVLFHLRICDHARNRLEWYHRYKKGSSILQHLPMPTDFSTDCQSESSLFSIQYSAPHPLLSYPVLWQNVQKFLAYLLYSAAISIFIYPVTGHWIWGGGWIAQMGFHDFAGSTAVHMVGGICALVGAKILGPSYWKI